LKILLVQNSPYVPVLTGASKANRLLLEELTEKKHSCRVVAPSIAVQGLKENARFAQFLSELKGEARSPTSLRHSAADDAQVFLCRGVEVHAVTDGSRLRAYLMKQIREFEPTWTLASSEDPGQIMLEAALKASPSRVVYLARTTLMLPFGPESRFPSLIKTEVLRQTSGIIAVSNYVKEYIRQWSGLESVVLSLPVYGSGPFPYFGSFDQGFVTMVNPCAMKGI